MSKKTVLDNSNLERAKQLAKNIITLRKEQISYNNMMTNWENELKGLMLHYDLDRVENLKIVKRKQHTNKSIKELKEIFNDPNLIDNLVVRIDFDETRENLRLNLWNKNLVDQYLNNIQELDQIEVYVLEETGK